MSRWEDRPNGHYCTVHNAEFDRGESCLACIVEPGQTALVGDHEEDHLEKELRLIEAACHERAKKCWRCANDMLDGNAGSTADACKLSAESTKWTRLALEINERRTQKHELAELIRKYRALLGKDGSN